MATNGCAHDRFRENSRQEIVCVDCGLPLEEARGGISINRICEKLSLFQHVCGRRRRFSSRTKPQKPESGGAFDSSRRAKCNINMFALIINICRTEQQIVKNKKSLAEAGVEVR